MENDTWFLVQDADQIDSPALLIYPDRIRHNIEQMVRMAGDPRRLRPHVKTHKMAEIIRMQQEAGIDKFKCATLAEAELLARCEAKEVLVAYPLTGPGPYRRGRAPLPRRTWGCRRWWRYRTGSGASTWC